MYMRGGACTALAIVALAACSNGESASAAGPLSPARAENGVLCVPSRTGDLVTVGQDTLENSATSAATITGVRLAEADEIDLVDSFVTPLRGTTTVGVHRAFPPRDLTGHPLANWERREPAAGAEIEGRSSRGLVVALRLTDQEGSARGFTIEYRVEGENFRYTTAVGLRLARTCDS